MNEAGPKLVLTRTLDAPVARVYAAWTDPRTMQRWLCAGEMTAPEVEAEVRVGGRYRVCMLEASGETHIVGGVYREVEQDRRLVFTWRWEGSEEETLVTVELAPAGESGTELTLTHEGFADEDIRDRHGWGWSSCLDKLSGIHGETVQ